MWELRGLEDRQIKLHDVCTPIVLHCSIVGGKQVSSTGRQLHGLYAMDAGKIRPAVSNLGGDASDGTIKVLFDLNGPTHLNYPGTLYLTDGDPSQVYQLSTSFAPCPFSPTWHALTARTRNGTYQIPDYHSRIRTAGAPVAFTMSGFSGVLDHIPIPVTGDKVILFEEPDVTVITEWWG